MSAGCRFRFRLGRFPDYLAVLIPLALVLSVPLVSFAQTQPPSAQPHLPAQGSYPEAISLDPATLDSTYMFRFSPSSPWRPFDRVLVLDAFPGEHRQYRVELLSNQSSATSRFDYEIDRKPPEMPSFIPDPGDAGPALTIGLSGEGSIMVSLNGQPFSPYNPEDPVTMLAPLDGSSIITALAYAVDEHGNTSLPVFAAWRLSHLSPEVLPFFDVGKQNLGELQVLDTTDGLSIRTGTEPGANPTVVLDVPEGTIPVISVQSSHDEISPASFIRLPASAGRARAEIPVPWGYDLELSVHYGYEEKNSLMLAGTASPIRAEFPYRSPPAPPQKAPEPLLSSSFGATLLSWPPSTSDLYFSIDGADFIRYKAPVLLPYRGPGSYELSYQAANAGGRSVPVSTSIQVLPRLEAPDIKGVEAGLTFGIAPALQVDARYGTVRFEMTTDGSEPIPPGSTSAHIAEAALFGGLDGQLVHYRLRLAAVDEAGHVGPERYLNFYVDRKAPPAPNLTHSLPAYSAQDLILALESSEPETFIYYSVSENGSERFQEYRGPVDLVGSDDGRKHYVVRAFAEDVYGNRSPEMNPVTVLVDRSSLYVDPAGKSGAAGTPDDPLPSLQDALMVSARSGRKIIYIRGNHVLGGPLKLAGNLRLLGGYAADWTVSQREHASIRFNRPLESGSTGLKIQGGLLELRSVGIISEGTGVSVLIDAIDASLVMTQVSLAMSGGLEATAIKLESSRLILDGVDISISSVVTGRALDAMNSDNTVDKLTVSADSSVQLFDALRMVGGASSIQNLRMDASPGLAFSGLSLSRTQVFLSGSAFFIKGGASTLRLIHLNAAGLTADSLFGNIDWLGESELFRLGSSSSLRLSHATILSKARRLSVVESRDSNWSIFNSIFNTDSPGAVFAASNTQPTSGSVSANCLWGFTSYFAWGARSGSLVELNAYASLGHPNFIEPSSKTFVSKNKGLPILSSSSACIGTAAPLPWTLPAQLKPNLSTPVSRDIGVDGLREGRL